MLRENKSKLIKEDSEEQTKGLASSARLTRSRFFLFKKYDFVNNVHSAYSNLQNMRCFTYKVKFLKSRNHRQHDAYVILIVQYFHQTQIFHSWREERKSRISHLMLKLIVRFIKRSSSSHLRAERNVLSLIISCTVSGPGIFMTYEMCLKILSSSFVFTFWAFFSSLRE